MACQKQGSQQRVFGHKYAQKFEPEPKMWTSWTSNANCLLLQYIVLQRTKLCSSMATRLLSKIMSAVDVGLHQSDALRCLPVVVFYSRLKICIRCA